MSQIRRIEACVDVSGHFHYILAWQEVTEDNHVRFNYMGIS